MKKAKRVLEILILITVVSAFFYMIAGIVSILRAPFTSFPWHAACVFTAYYFAPPLLAEAIIYSILCWKIRWRKRQSKSKSESS